MNHNSQRMQPNTLRQPQLHKLILIAAISNAQIRPRRNQIQNVIVQDRFIL